MTIILQVSPNIETINTFAGTMDFNLILENLEAGDSVAPGSSIYN